MRLIVLLSFLLFTQCSLFRQIPPGTALIKLADETVFLDKTEVTNNSWKEYLFWLRQEYGDTSLQYMQALPNNEIMHRIYGKSFTELEPLYRNYPIIGITYNQATSYCEWRSWAASQTHTFKMLYSLPDLEDYQAALEQKSNSERSETLYSANINLKGFSGLCDNAAEMTSINGLAISGDFNADCLSLIEYDEPTDYLGFRCRAIILED
jgi:hypothetical protein